MNRADAAFSPGATKRLQYLDNRSWKLELLSRIAIRDEPFAMAWRGSRAGWTIKRSVMKPTILNGLKHPLRSARRLRDKLSFSYAEHFEPEDFVGIPANRALSETKYYVSFVTQAVENYKVFSRFKSDPRYRAVLEHVSPQVGADYLSIIRQQTPELLDDFDRFKVNDIVGSPLTHVFPAIGECSPTTLRYVKVASDLKVYFGSDIGSHIAEIGVGYGGQLLINDQIFKIANVTFTISLRFWAWSKNISSLIF